MAEKETRYLLHHRHQTKPDDRLIDIDAVLGGSLDAFAGIRSNIEKAIKAQDAKTFVIAYQKGWDESALIKNAEWAEKYLKAAGELTRQIIELDTERDKCFHCEKSDGILIRLNPAPEVLKTVCLECLWSRHPKTSLEILEFILDKEQEDNNG